METSILRSGLKDQIMDEDKKNRLENAGFKVGSIEEFLNLTLEEKAKIDNIIIRNGKPIGVCDCLGKGKNKCKGNGWVRDGSGFQKCPYFQEFH
jgi:hypothetical protein